MQIKYTVTYADGVKRFKKSPTGEFTGTMDKKVGDEVACLIGCRLEVGHDGKSRKVQTNKTYASGICKSVHPFIIVSPEGDGIWKKKNPDHYFSLEKE